MTTVVVNSGACGHTVRIIATKNPDRTLTLTLDTPCEAVRKMQADIATLDRFAPLAGFQSNPVYTAAAKHLKHVACPVPSAILKALEVASGMNVPRDVVIRFSRD